LFLRDIEGGRGEAHAGAHRNGPQRTSRTGTQPIRPVCSQGDSGRIEVFPQYAEGLDDIEGFSHLHLI